MTRLLVVLAIVAASPLVRADDFDAERIPLRLRIGETREIEVGYARMHVCDDPTIVEAQMRDKNADTNVFFIKGLKPGTTDCRVGLDPEDGRPSYLYSITVERPAPAPKRRGPPPRT